MELTLNSSSSLIKRKEIKSSRNQESSSSISFAKMKPPPTYQFQAKNSVKEMKFTHEKSTFKPEGEATERWEKLHVLSYPHTKNDSSVPVFVMLPLDTVTMSGHLNKPRAMNASLMALKGAGVEGVMVDAWWGLVEKDGPMKYNWEGYAELIHMVQKHGLKLQVVMSFHQCGGNVGDSCR